MKDKAKPLMLKLRKNCDSGGSARPRSHRKSILVGALISANCRPFSAFMNRGCFRAGRCSHGSPRSHHRKTEWCQSQNRKIKNRGLLPVVWSCLTVKEWARLITSVLWALGWVWRRAWWDRQPLQHSRSDKARWLGNGTENTFTTGDAITLLFD